MLDEAPLAMENLDDSDDSADSFLDDHVQLYLRDIGRVPLLTAEQELRLAQIIDQGREAEHMLASLPPDNPAVMNLRILKERKDEAQQQMAEANLRLVVSIAKQYRNRGLPLLDMIQEGNLGLLRAIERFDPSKGYRFSTYATSWIKQSILRALTNQSRLMRLSSYQEEMNARIRNASRQLTQRLGREPTDTELSHALGMSVDKICRIRRLVQSPVSLDALTSDDSDATLADILPDPQSQANDIDDEVVAGMIRQRVNHALCRLDDRDRAVLEFRYGLADGQPHTLAEIGERFNITRERVRQLEQRALRQLRGMLTDCLD